MLLLERMIRHIEQRDDVWIAQMGEIADEFRRRQ
jgi:hypothetical protein